MRKKRILFVTEASFLVTGFSKQASALLKHLYSTNKYEIAELGCYCQPDDNRIMSVPWKFYCATPSPNNQLAYQRYQNSMAGQFGESVFEQVCLDFHPDIVIDERDEWMSRFQLDSSFRDLYKILWVPTIDGEPQKLSWIDGYTQADLIITHAKYGKDLLEREAGNRIKVFGVLRDAVDPTIHKPMNKKMLRKKYDIPENINIVSTVMRNQKRKLYPDLFNMFRKFLIHCVKSGNSKLAKDTYLYIHTSYPDVGFDIGKLILQNGLGCKVFATYTCNFCKCFYPDYFQSELSVCRNCRQLGLHMPNTQDGISEENMAEILNLSDIYIQYATCEGLGMPIAEAKACGVPALAVDYSAMSEQVTTDVGCSPIKVAKFVHESVIETEQSRALPDDDDAINKLYEFLTLSDDQKKHKSALARKDASENYSFQRAGKILEEAIDSLDVKDHQETWLNQSSRMLKLPQDIPQVNTNSQFIDWCIDSILQKPSLKRTQWRNDLIKGLNIGYVQNKNNNMQRDFFNREAALNMFFNKAKEHNFWESTRLSAFKDKADTISYQIV
jgi:glycosyltransferase involved in cell wall biosynthesis